MIRREGRREGRRGGGGDIHTVLVRMLDYRVYEMKGACRVNR